MTSQRASDGFVAYPVHKHIGSDIAGLDFDISGLRTLIDSAQLHSLTQEVAQ